MKKTIIFLITLCALLKIGYYTSIEDEELKTTFFIKQTPTFRLKFYNIFATEEDFQRLDRLRPDERIDVIDYCKYRVGLAVELKTEAELIACSVR